MISRDRFNQEIQNIVEQLIRVYKPEKVILFGSLAKGKMNEGTDIDFFIIKKDVPELGIDRIRELDALIKYRIATDFIVYKSAEVEERLKLEDPFIKSIIEEGKILYNAS